MSSKNFYINPSVPLQHILDDCGIRLTRYEPVHGGDINSAYCLYGADAKYFLKINDRKRYPAMFEKEANGLKALHQNCTLKIPRVIKQGNTGACQYLLLEWMEAGYPETASWQNFGAGLAMLHKKQWPFFGWQEDNFIGSLVQHNQHQPNWHLFYGQYRIMPLVKDLFNTGAFSKQDLGYAESFCKRIDQLFPSEPPALLHGDLWSGNYMMTGKACVAVFDPAVYCGHREMDIGMTSLFGGFDRQFYNAYNDAYPLEKGWQQRLPLTQLYPLLVHGVLFGGHYAGTVKGIIKQFS